MNLVSGVPMSEFAISKPPVWRQFVLLGLMSVWFGALSWKVVLLQTQDHDYLQSQGDKRYLREIRIFPERGAIFDRNNQVLTVSTPVQSLVADPRLFCAENAYTSELEKVLDISAGNLEKRCEKYAKSEFMYVKRQLAPVLVERIMDMEINGLEVRREYKRYYPGGVASAHLVGFTDVDNLGQEGLERLFDQELTGSGGRSRVLKSMTGQHVESVESIYQVQHGKDLVVSIDQRLQSLASDYLKDAITQFNATSGSVVVLSVPSGELLTLVNFPQFNPNDRSTFKSNNLRNRAITDPVEPGSTVKPFTIAMALESEGLSVDSKVDTSPGRFHVGKYAISDSKDYGNISLFDVVVHSSNIGSAKVALSMPYENLYQTFANLGFGEGVMGLPDESSGSLQKRTHTIEHATLSYGYGISATPLQLARAYTALATDGILLPITLGRKPSNYAAEGKRVFSPETVLSIREMLEQVATEKGTAEKAQVPGYRIGGKTGTTHKVINKEYASDRYISSFVGLAPISNPRFVVAVVIDDPRGEDYFGGDVAAPVFANITQDLLRLYNIKPDGVNFDLNPISTMFSTSKENQT